MPATLELDLPTDYTPSEGELNNFVYLICKYTVGWQMRACDLAVCLLMASPSPAKEPIQGPDGLNRLFDHTIEYVWDHLAGEPEDPSVDRLREHMKPALEEWYKCTTLEERANTS